MWADILLHFLAMLWKKIGEEEPKIAFLNVEAPKYVGVMGWTVWTLLHLSYSVFYFFSLSFVSGPCARLSWPSRQLLSARKSTVSYRIVSYIRRPVLVGLYLFVLVPFNVSLSLYFKQTFSNKAIVDIRLRPRSTIPSTPFAADNRLV